MFKNEYSSNSFASFLVGKDEAAAAAPQPGAAALPAAALPAAVPAVAVDLSGDSLCFF